MAFDLYRSDTVVVRCVPGEDTARWLVTFDHHSIGAGFDRLGFGEAFLAREGFSALHILGRGNDWYQYADIAHALVAAHAHLANARRVVTYGSSMGGYAALRFARRLGAHAAIALSPQYSNDPRVVPWETRWIDDALRIAWRPELRAPLWPCPRSILIYDPVTDARHAAAVAAEAPSVLLPIAYAGHPVAGFLAETGLLRPLLRSVLDDRFDPAAWRREARDRRRRSSIYLGELAVRQPRHRSALAVTLGRRALAVAPGSTLALYMLGTALSRSGEHDEAERLFAEAVRTTGRADAVMLFGAAAALLAAGRIDAALYAVDEAITLRPGAHLFAWRAAALWKAGRRREAIFTQLRAVRIAPRSASYWRGLRRYCWRSLRRPLGRLRRRPDDTRQLVKQHCAG